MTTIAYRDGMLAADTMLVADNAIYGFGRKAYRAGRILFAAAGCTARAQRFRDWMRRGMQGDVPDMHAEKEGDGATGYVYTPDGVEVSFFPNTPPLAAKAEFYAHGSGGWIALGAMEAGATAEEAVRAAAKWDNNTGGDITVLRHTTP